MKRLGRVALLVAVNLGVLALLLLVIEGGTSMVLALRDGGEPPVPLAEQRHTHYDSLLGWVNTPGVSRGDMYGPGIALTVNPQGFRGSTPTPPATPAGLTRVVCSGDSFTLGYGVADADTWCHRLGVLDPSLEMVNMGQGGYGFDQAWLWYRRDGDRLRPDIHIFAFISDDFRRMEDDQFIGYAKPVLVLDGDSLVAGNVPVPEPPAGVAAWLAGLGTRLGSLRSVELLRRVRGRIAGPDGDAATAAVAMAAARERIRPVVARAVEELAAQHARHNGTLVLAHLPTAYELDGVARDVADEWRTFMADVAARHGVAFVDLFASFEGLAPAERAAMFLDEAAVAFPQAAGHYTVAGNAMVARELHGALVERGLLDPAPR